MKTSALNLLLLMIACLSPVASADDMALVPAGSFIRGGTTYMDEGPVQEVWVEAFWMDKVEVTNSAFKQFDPGHAYPSEKADYPVTGITWYQARDYAAWAGKRLPTELEWEKAARGVDGRTWPWGNVFKATRCNSWLLQPFDMKKAGSLPKGNSPFGIADMAGNAWEWTASSYLPYPGSEAEIPEAGRFWRVVRGGFTPAQSRCAFRGFRMPYYSDPHIGFRCAKDAEPGQPAPDQNQTYLEDLPNPNCDKPASPDPGADAEVRVDAASDSGPLLRLNRRISQPSTDSRDEFDRMLPLIRDLQLDTMRLDMLHGDEAVRDKEGTITINWSRADYYFNRFRELGIHIIYQLAHAPAFVSRKGSPGEYEPSDLETWAAYVREVVRHVRIERNEDIVCWEVWGEPDLVRSQTNPEDIDAFLRFWGATARAIMEVDPDARLAGPATVIPTPQWLERFYDYLVENGLPVDVVTWHLYNAPPWRFQQEAATTMKLLSRYPELGRPEIGVTEWNAYAGHFHVNDDHFGAANAAVNLILLQDGSIKYPMFFQLFDGWDFQPPVVDEEFWGRWGMITFPGRPKAVCNFYRLMNKLGDTRVTATTNQPDLWILATRDRGAVQLLLVDYRVPLNVILPGWMPNPLKSTSRGPFFGPPHDPMSSNVPEKEPLVSGSRTVKLDITNLLPASARRCRRYLIDEAHSNGYRDVARADLEMVEDIILSSSGTTVSLQVDMTPYAITLLELEPAALPHIVLSATEPFSPDKAVSGDFVKIAWALRNITEHPVFPKSLKVSSPETSLEVKGKLPARIDPGATVTMQTGGRLGYTAFPAQQILEAVLSYEDRRGGIYEVSTSRTILVQPALEVSAVTPSLDILESGRFVVELDNHSCSVQEGTLEFVEPAPDLGWKPVTFKLKPGERQRLGLPLAASPGRFGVFDLFWRIRTPDMDFVKHYATAATGFRATRLDDAIADSVFTEWPAGAWIEIPSAMHDRSRKGPDDCSARFAVGFDNERLFLAVEVKDDFHAQEHEGASIWNGDSIQVAMDPLRNPNLSGGYNEDDVEFGFALTQDGPQGWCWAGGQGSGPGEAGDIDLVVQRKGRTVRYEAGLPWTRVRPLGPEWGRPFGLCVHVNDDDGGGDQAGRGYLEWAGSIGHGKQPSQFLPVWLKAPLFSNANKSER